jgi:tagatose 1,6-diphosphate aldolase
VTAGWTPARARRLDEISGSDGIVVGVAIDHRDALRAALAKKGLPDLDDAGVTRFKLRIARALAPAATVVLLDVEHGAAQALAAGVLPGSVALAVPLEAQGYGDVQAVPHTTFLPGWSPAAAARLGASACKLLLPYRVDVDGQADAQDEVVRTALAGCRAAGVALIVEPIVYGEVDAARRAELVVAGAARLAGIGPDVLKVQHPGSAAACAELDDACGSDVPWVLLGGGADPAVLERQVDDACGAGASGFMVGRTLWDAALVEDESESERALREVSRPLLERLAASARSSGRPWRERVGPIAEPEPGWHAAAPV